MSEPKARERDSILCATESMDDTNLCMREICSCTLSNFILVSSLTNSCKRIIHLAGKLAISLEKLPAVKF